MKILKFSKKKRFFLKKPAEKNKLIYLKKTYNLKKKIDYEKLKYYLKITF